MPEPAIHLDAVRGPSPAVAPCRRPELDALRVLAMAGVVGIHVLATALAATHSRAPLPYLALDRLLNAVCVPAFVFLTGMLLWGADGGTGARWWLRRAEVVFVPYAAWSVVYWALPLTTGRADLPAMLVRLPGTIAFGTAAYHLWFPPVLLLVYALTPLARRARRASPELLALAVLAASLAAPPALRWAAWPPDLTGLLQDLATFVPYAAFGAWFAARERRSPRWALVGAGAIGASLLLAGAFGLSGMPDVLTVVATAAALMLAVRELTRLPAALAAPSKDAAAVSFGVYLAHPLVLAIVREPLARADLRGLWGSPAFTLAAYGAVLGVALAFAAGLKRRPALSRLA